MCSSATDCEPSGAGTPYYITTPGTVNPGRKRWFRSLGRITLNQRPPVALHDHSRWLGHSHESARRLGVEHLGARLRNSILKIAKDLNVRYQRVWDDLQEINNGRNYQPSICW
jgi:hypothetical protein